MSVIQTRLEEKEFRLQCVLSSVVRYVQDATRLIEDKNGVNARGRLCQAANAVDKAMGLIDELMAPEPTESERTGD